MSAPSSLSTTYATDEDVVAVAGADFQVLANRWGKFASGTDGVFSAGDLWTLTSASNNFTSQGLKSNMVCQLLKPAANFPGSGDLLAIDSVATNALTLRRIGQALHVGQAPAPTGGLTGVTFLVTSLQTQLDDVSFWLNEKFSIDPGLPNRTPGDVYDLRVVRTMTVYETVLRQYANMNRSKAGDFADKIDFYREAFERQLAGATLRWGPQGNSQQTTTIFGTKLVR